MEVLWDVVVVGERLQVWRSGMCACGGLSTFDSSSCTLLEPSYSQVHSC